MYVSIGDFMRLFNKKNIKKAFTLVELTIVMLIIGMLSLVLIHTLRSKKYEEKTNFLMAQKTIESMTNVFQQIRQTETEVVPAGKYMTKVGDTYEYTVLSTDGNGALANTTELAGLVGDYMKKNGDIIEFCSVTGSCSDLAVKGFKLPGNFYVGFEIFYGTGSKPTPADCPAFRMPGDNENEYVPNKNFDGTTKKCWGKLHIDINGSNPPNKPNEDYYVFGLDEYGIVTTGEKHEVTEIIEEPGEEETVSEPASGI